MSPKRMPSPRRVLFPFLLPAALLLPGACAGTGEGRDDVRAAAVPEAGRLAQDVRWLADDRREGRRAGTPGEQQAARWLAQRLEALGCEPAGTDGFLQPFEVPLPVRDGGGSSLEVRAEDMLVACEGEGLVPLYCSSGGSAEGRLVFGGYGVVAPDLGRDDYGELAVDGAIVLLVRGTPPDALLPGAGAAAHGEAPANPHGDAQPVARSWGGAGGIFHKVMEAKRRGARAVVVAQHPAGSEPMLAFGDGGGAQARIPVLHVSAEEAERLLPGYAERVRRLDEGGDAGPEGARTAVLKADVHRERGTATNVLGLLPGRDRSRVVVIGAHFDHLGRGGAGSLAPDQQGEIHNGADDNASGTAAVLELARVLSEGPPPPCDVLFALWSGEELGLYGSKAWVDAPTVPLDTVAANLNLDMVGRAGSGKLSVLGAGSAREFDTLLATAGPRAGLQLQVSLSGQGVGGSDHQPFLEREIPALHFFTGLHSDYHRPSDDHEGVEPEGTARVCALVLDLLDDLAEARLAFVPPSAENAGQALGGFKTRFGSIPDYVFDGPGMRLDGTSPGGPAEKAGLLKGDVLVDIAGTTIDGLGDFMHVLNTHKPGDVLLVRFLRDGQEEECRVTLESSQVE